MTPQFPQYPSTLCPINNSRIIALHSSLALEPTAAFGIVSAIASIPFSLTVEILALNVWISTVLPFRHVQRRKSSSGIGIGFSKWDVITWRLQPISPQDKQVQSTHSPQSSLSTFQRDLRRRDNPLSGLLELLYLFNPLAYHSTPNTSYIPICLTSNTHHGESKHIKD